VVGHEDHGSADEFGTIAILAPTEREPFMRPLCIRGTSRAKGLCDERHEPASLDMQCAVRASYRRVPAGRERCQRYECASPASLDAL
jgi:hypothetical protein